MSKQKKQTTRRFPRLTLTTVLVASVILAIAAVTVVSRQKARATKATEVERSAPVEKKSDFVKVKVAGQEVEVDGQTGKIKPLTPEEAMKLAAGLGQLVNQSTEGLEQVHHPDGSVTMDLKGRFQNVTVARVNEDGTVTQSCVDNPRDAGAFFGIDPKLIEQEASKSTEKQSGPKTLERKQ